MRARPAPSAIVVLAGALLALAPAGCKETGGGSDPGPRDVTVAWDAVTENADSSPIGDLSGYALFWSTKSFKSAGSYMTLEEMQADASVAKKSVGSSATEATLSLEPGKYYLRLAAFDSEGLYSAPNLDSGGADTELELTVTDD
jgi:hypothetical protein